MTHTFRLLINGQLVAGADHSDVINPATEQVLARSPRANAAQLEEAVAAAKAAFPAWAAKSQEERGALLDQIGDRLLARTEEFAHLLTSEQGKPLDQARHEVMGTAFVLKSFGQMRVTDTVLVNKADHQVFEHRTPLGVCAAITPWNFPLILLAHKLGPALVTGNTMVAKPAPTTPLTTLLLGEILAEVLPAGVVNILCDQNDLGALLSSHPDIAKVAFTGSTATGKRVMASAAGTVKRVTLEMGGNDAAIVLGDMPPKLAAQKVYQGAMANAGQICVAIKRAYVHETIYDAFLEEIAELARHAVVGDGTQQGVTVGPVQNRMQFEKVSALLAQAAQTGTVLAGGAPLDRPGFFLPPTIVADLDDDAPLVREEQFGPVLPVLKFSDIDDVIARANNSDYGLGGTVWSKDPDRGIAVALRINSGTVWVNQHLAIDANIPFRGVKQSGLGSELGEAGLLEYTQAHIVNAVPL